LALVLGIAGASRFYWIGRFNRLHAVTNGRGTRNSSATNLRYQRNIKQRFSVVSKRRFSTTCLPRTASASCRPISKTDRRIAGWSRCREC
jgi:hypothetical protein